MKKIFALILIALMLLPLTIACGKVNDIGDSTNSSEESTESNKETQTNTDTDTGTVIIGNGFSSKETVLDKWKGTTLNVLASTWHTTEPCAPWSCVELCVDMNKSADDNNFGQQINTAVLQRQQKIKDIYGVTVNWIQNGPLMANTLATESATPQNYYHIIMPRMLECQDLVYGDYVYDMSQSKYIDFSHSYFNKAAYESYTVGGHTLFAAGDFNFLDEMTSYCVFYNKTMASTFPSFPDLYEMVKNGTWTIDQMFTLARAVYGDDGDGEQTDTDTYGYGTNTLSQFYQTSGIMQVSVDKDEDAYTITLNDEKVGKVIDKILQIVNSKTWARTTWEGNYGDNCLTAFTNNRLLFYNQVVQHYDRIAPSISKDFEIGLLPCPKLDSEQEDYCTPCSYQSVCIGIPRTTNDREMSEYFIDVLSWTGQDYIMKAYFDRIADSLPDEESAEIMLDYVFPNLIYDQGYMYSYDGLLNNVQYDSYSTGVNKFADEFTNSSEAAWNIVNRWNESWQGYSD